VDRGEGLHRDYRALREGIPAHYRAHFPLTPAARARRHLNPGNGTVSKLCHEPRAALAVIDGLAAHVDGGSGAAELRWT
jgi:hypothetical protein